VFTLVKSIHLINADDDYDVSFSEPDIPFTIFISVPHFRGTISVLRITEALVHEAMHLQLTLVERIVDLIKPSASRYFSPWRGEYRSAQGVLHALYVFRVIDRLFEELSVHCFSSCPEGLNHMHYRRCEVSEQIQDVKTFSDCRDLTELGANFVKQLLQNHRPY
jgi:HEXXH motif-containing protein